MRTAFILSFLANVALSLLSLAVLPARVAIHFGPGGAADGWASGSASTAIMLGVQILLFLSLYLSPRLLARVPARWINLPNRDYWLAPQRRTQALSRLSDHLWRYGTALFLFLLVAGLLTLQANLSDPVRLDERLFLGALLVFLVYTAWWIGTLLRAFRAPSGSAH
ncbi:MAG: DUF1648 domain-containing protein [Bdellovibrio bacteriovorus]